MTAFRKQALEAAKKLRINKQIYNGSGSYADRLWIGSDSGHIFHEWASLEIPDPGTFGPLRYWRQITWLELRWLLQVGDWK